MDLDPSHLIYNSKPMPPTIVKGTESVPKNSLDLLFNKFFPVQNSRSPAMGSKEMLALSNNLPGI
jgi:hypothetical protein